MTHFYVYILRCSDGSYYTGHTDNIEARMSQHKQGLIKNCYIGKIFETAIKHRPRAPILRPVWLRRTGRKASAEANQESGPTGRLDL
ncbi:MAG: GIY-YIG nuclease family protein [Eubacteriales bacterium]